MTLQLFRPRRLGLAPLVVGALALAFAAAAIAAGLVLATLALSAAFASVLAHL